MALKFYWFAKTTYQPSKIKVWPDCKLSHRSCLDAPCSYIKRIKKKISSQPTNHLSIHLYLSIHPSSVRACVPALASFVHIQWSIGWFTHMLHDLQPSWGAELAKRDLEIVLHSRVTCTMSTHYITVFVLAVRSFHGTIIPHAALARSISRPLRRITWCPAKPGEKLDSW